MDTTTRKTQRPGATLPEEISIAYSEETELHWRRIVTAVLIVLALLTTMGWILMNLISAERAAQVVRAEDADVEEVASEEENTAVATPEPETQPIDDVVPDIVPGELPGALPKLNEILTRTPREKPQTAAPSAPINAPDLPVKVQPIAAQKTDAPLALTAPPFAGGLFLAATGEKETAQVTGNPFYIGSLQLTSELVDKSPTDLLGAEITLGDRQLIKIYAYSELTNLKGEQVFYEWYQGDKRVARIPVGVYLDDMRISTSKYIDQTMGGDWHLEIIRHNGEQLGRMDFRVNVDS